MSTQVHLVDGTLELFRSYHSPRNDDPVRGAARGAVAAASAGSKVARVSPVWDLAVAMNPGDNA